MTDSRITVIHVPEEALEENTNTFEIGDRVRLKDEFRPPKADVRYWQGEVISVPDGKVFRIGPHKLGNEVTVKPELESGVFVADADRLEKI